MNKRNAPIYAVALLSLVMIAGNISATISGVLSYYLTGVIGFGVIFAGSFVTIFRIWDAVTDLAMGNIADKTHTKIGRFTPYILAGVIGTVAVAFAMVYIPPMIPEGTARKAVFIILYMLFVICTTLLVSGNRSAAQICFTDSKRRATLGMMNGIYMTIYYTVVNVYIYQHLMPSTRGFNLEFFQRCLPTLAIAGSVSALAFLLCYAKYDRMAVEEELQTSAGKQKEKVTLKDAVRLFKTNRPFLMLILSAGTDKLATTLQGNATVVLIMYGICAGNSKLSSAVNSYTMIPSIIMILLGLGAVGRKYGSKKALLIASWGGLVVCGLSVLLWIFGDFRTLNFPGYDNYSGWSTFTIAYLVLFVMMKGFATIGGQALNPMLADVIDYEYYLSGKYCPGTIGALFNLADKIISSLGPTIISILCVLIGFGSQLPTAEDPFSIPLFAVGLIGLYGLSILGLLVNLVCLKFYPLTPEYMDKIHSELALREN
jgi:Na+/melibiose symporter-like transporter